jgi:hypothetical protein
MTTLILTGFIVILVIALAIIAFAWRLAVYDANEADSFILAIADECRAGMLSNDGVMMLRDEAENIREWRGEVQGND